jgi:IS30 family transposase
MSKRNHIITAGNKNKHLTFEDRLTIQEGLKTGGTFKSIARHLGKSATTISREVKRHLTVVHSNAQRKDKSGNPISEMCSLLLKPPFCCNACKKMVGVCVYDKHKYLAKEAQKTYEETLVDSRTGIPLNKKEFYDTEAIISDRVKNGQKIYHVITTCNLPVSKTSVYRHINKGYMSIGRSDLPRAVKFKPRKEKPQEHIPKGLKIGRSFADFETFLFENKIETWVEMDSLIGRIGGKIIITFHFVGVDLMFGLLSKDKFAASTTETIQNLKQHLNKNGIRFGEFFSVLLTDNGGEFANVFCFENELEGDFSVLLRPVQVKSKTEG